MKKWLVYTAIPALLGVGGTLAVTGAWNISAWRAVLLGFVIAAVNLIGCAEGRSESDTSSGADS